MISPNSSPLSSKKEILSFSTLTTFRGSKPKPKYNTNNVLIKVLDGIVSSVPANKFIFDVQKYYNQIFVYQMALKMAKEENGKLLKLLKPEHK